MVELFSVPAFFILFRETLEAAIIMSVMMSLLDKLIEDLDVRRRMKWQAWWGVIAGLAISLALGAVFISLYYTVAKEAWENSEALWEGIMALIAVVLITLMAFAMVRVDTWRAKWERKLTKITVESLNKSDAVQSKRSKYALFLIPLTVVVREGLEAVIFLGGVELDGSGTALPIAAFTGALCGVLVGYLLYKGASYAAFKWFIGFSTLLLFVIAAGLFSFAVHEFEEHTENEDIVWKLDCCNHNDDGIWKVLNAIVGWRNEATIGTLCAYIFYWVFVVAAFVILRMKWKKEDAEMAIDAKESELPTVSPYGDEPRA
eukprot:jgi/Mesen1/10968/ME000096S10542